MIECNCDKKSKLKKSDNIFEEFVKIEADGREWVRQKNIN